MTSCVGRITLNGRLLNQRGSAVLLKTPFAEKMAAHVTDDLREYVWHRARGSRGDRLDNGKDKCPAVNWRRSPHVWEWIRQGN
jgi:hypothetical protein